MKFIACLLVLSASGVSAQKLLPTDDAVKDPSFFTFRAQLMQALERKDTAFLYSVLAPDIKLSFGGEYGVADFKRMWKLNEANSALWPVLLRALSLGGQLEDSTFTAPYVFARWPQGYDAFEHVVIVGENVTVRSAPRGPAITSLSFDIVRFKDWQGLGESGEVSEQSWAQIELPDRRTGWVHGRYVYSPIGYRARFEKRAGRWVMTIFIAGD